jgi:hypothetical protein
MTRSRWLLILACISAVIAAIALSDRGLSQRYAEAWRNAQLSAEGKDLVFGLLAVAVGGYLAWFMFLRRDK